MEQNDQLVAVCKQFDVSTLYVFGSALNDNYDENKSDIDFLVKFKNNAVKGSARRYFKFEEALQNIFKIEHIDLVVENALKNPYFIEEINKTRQVLYAS